MLCALRPLNFQLQPKDVHGSNLSTGIVEAGQRLHGPALGVEADDVLHDLRLPPPVQSLEVVGRHHVDVFLPRYAGKEDDLFRVTGLQQGFHGL